MGFAGQVFAARVAVGLAMPSPAAFSQAGAAIVKFSSDIYNNLNRQNVQAASTASQNASKELNTQQQRMKKHMSSQNDFMKKTLRTQLTQYPKDTKNGVKRLVLARVL